MEVVRTMTLTIKGVNERTAFAIRRFVGDVHYRNLGAHEDTVDVILYDIEIEINNIKGGVTAENKKYYSLGIRTGFNNDMLSYVLYPEDFHKIELM